LSPRSGEAAKGGTSSSHNLRSSIPVAARNCLVRRITRPVGRRPVRVRRGT
jgi:hypothetical protein